MNDKFIKKTELCFNVNELDAGLQSILENSIAKHTLENINQLSPDSNVKKDLYEILEIFSNFYKTNLYMTLRKMREIWVQYSAFTCSLVLAAAVQ